VVVNAPGASRPPLDPGLLRELAPAWTTVEIVAATPSTNALVVARASEGAADGLVVVADHQTAGRGRLDRIWVTPARAALTFSVLLRPEVPDHRWPWLPLLAGVSVVEALEAAGGPACALKWPNDVMYDGRKLAGLLVERIETSSGSAAVLGIGLNVSTTDEELPVPGAASLATVGYAGLDRSALLVGVLDVLGRRLRRWTREGGDPREGMLEDYTARCETVGRPVRVHLPAGGELVGTAVGVAGDGGLVVDDGSHEVTVSAGDVVHVRPA
jgi:BirA family biotin operon repressor/biotin-[acetyl-CoA-carboxylase] ligase